MRAALDLVDAIGALGAERGVDDLALRGGVHTGEAVVTIGASGMGMVAGDLVNTAARLQSVAEPGTVLVGEGTRRAADTAIVFEEAGAQTLKGKELPVAAFRALRVVAQRGGVGRAEGLEPPFVGREAELRLIKDFYHATARERGPRLVSVIGQAGIGKSRLAWEFLKYIDGVTEVVYWHQGRSPAYGDGISFWALGEMVRMRIGVGEGADDAETRERLAATLEEFVTDADERRSLTDPLLHLLGIGEAPTRRPQPAVRRMACVLRAHRRARPGRHGLRGPPVGGRWSPRLRRGPAHVVSRPIDLPHHAVSAGAPRPPPELGRRTAKLHVAERVPARGG